MSQHLKSQTHCCRPLAPLPWMIFLECWRPTDVATLTFAQYIYKVLYRDQRVAKTELVTYSLFFMKAFKWKRCFFEKNYLYVSKLNEVLTRKKTEAATSTNDNRESVVTSWTAASTHRQKEPLNDQTVGMISYLIVCFPISHGATTFKYVLQNVVSVFPPSSSLKVASEDKKHLWRFFKSFTLFTRTRCTEKSLENLSASRRSLS